MLAVQSAAIIATLIAITSVDSTEVKQQTLGVSSNLRTTTVLRNLESSDSSCECKLAPRPCVFFHGIGNKNEMAELQDIPKNTSGRMGNMNAHAPCCSTVKYAVLNTVDYGWTDDTLQQKFCDHALSMSDSSDVIAHSIRDTVVVTHSMGGLVMAGAVATGKCRFDVSSAWVSISAPMMGSMAADYIEDFCNDEIDDIKTELFDLLGYCPVPVARKSITYQNEKHSSPELNAAYTAAQKAYGANVYASMCSNYYDGVVSQYQVQSVIAGKIIPHKSRKNDGLVEFQSCAAGLSESLFGDSYEYRFYAPRLNHADTAFLTHDGLFKDSQKPFKWFECLF
ncbi:hypothetical protein PC123_g5359 [Phytophthora cactorum]|nr:hypothetical protein PC123_g5359 [Phytophthora cactorum]